MHFSSTQHLPQLSARLPFMQPTKVTAFHCAVAGLLAFAKAVLVADPDDDFIMMTALESLAPHLIL